MTVSRRSFDREFFDRYYHTPATAVISAQEVYRRARFVTSYLAHLQVEVRSVLDIGCGTGLWKRALRRLDRSITYTGVDPSEYLCRRYGWTRGSVVDLPPRRKFDLVVCQDVLQYVSAPDVDRGLAAIARVCRGAVYLDVPTRDDIDAKLLDLRRTDRRIHVRSAAWYRRRMERRFANAGGGVFVSPRARAVLLSLEKLGR